METTTPTPHPRKKRSRASGSPDNSGDDSKKRGRPRVEKQDQSAADRRRTQIRMAQRAYRQRKESTLDELRKRVSGLTTTMELMNKAFLDCRDRLLAANLPESCLHDIRDTSIQYEAMMKSARNAAEEADPDVAQSIHRRPSTGSMASAETQKMPAEPKNVPSWMDESALNPPPKQSGSMEVGLGYTMYLPENNDASPSLDYFNNFSDQAQALVPVSKQPHLNSFDTFHAELPESLSISLSPPRTYSFQESTFARRLHRACLEQAYEILLDPQRRPATYDRVFKLSLMSRDRAKLTASIKAVLNTGPHEPLDQPAPLIHVGGAGTHYPRRDQFGNLHPKKESWNLGIVGPQALALLENAARDNLTSDMTVDIAGFEGDWFDPYDVEGYLAEKGIHIDPSSSFAEAEVLVHTVPSGSASTFSTISASPKSPNGFWQTQNAAKVFDVEQLESLSRDNATPNDWTDLSMVSHMSIGFSDAVTGSWMNFLPPGEATKQHAPINPIAQQDTAMSEMMTWEGSRSSEVLADSSDAHMYTFSPDLKKKNTTQVQEKKAVIIDVAKFITVMMVSGVCIGRTPGFRRKDVDRALALSSFDAF